MPPGAVNSVAAGPRGEMARDLAEAASSYDAAHLLAFGYRE
jgi:hypothetical protein